MGEYRRSKSYSHSDIHGRNMQIEVYGGRGSSSRGSESHDGGYDLRSYSTSYAAASSSVYNTTNYGHGHQQQMQPELKKGKSVSNGWGILNDPELQRKKRVASYKVYAVEGKVKGSFRKSFRWLKDRYTHVVYGWW